MLADRQRIDLLNRSIGTRVGLAAYVQLGRARGYILVSENNHLRDSFFKLNRELHGKSLRLNFHLDQKRWSAFHHAEEALTIAAVHLMSGHHDYPTVIAINASKLENCLMSLTLSIQSLWEHATLEKA